MRRTASEGVVPGDFAGVVRLDGVAADQRSSLVQAGSVQHGKLGCLFERAQAAPSKGGTKSEELLKDRKFPCDAEATERLGGAVVWCRSPEQNILVRSQNGSAGRVQ